MKSPAPVADSVSGIPTVLPRRRGNRRWILFLSLAFGLPVSLLVGAYSFLPAMFRAGWFEGPIREKLTALLGAPATAEESDLPESSLLVLKNVGMERSDGRFGPLTVREVRVRFDAPFPVGSVREIELVGPRLILNVGGSGGSGGTVHFDPDLFGAVPLLRIREGKLEGTFAGEPFEVKRIDGILEGGTGIAGSLRFEGAAVEEKTLPLEATFDAVTRFDLIRTGSGAIEGRITVELPKGELFQSARYHDFAETNLVLNLAGRLDPTQGSCTLKGTSIEVRPFGFIGVEGDVEWAPEGVLYDMRFTTHGFPVDRLVKELELKDVVKIPVATGRISADLHVWNSGAAGWSARLRPEAVNLEWDGLVVRGMRGEIPFGRGSGASTETGGTLQIDSLEWKEMAFRDIALEVTAGPGGVSLSPGLRTGAWGGTVAIDHPVIRLDPSFEATASVELRALDTGRISREVFGLSRPVAGTLSASFPSASWTEERILFSGPLRLNVLGGSLRSESLEVRNPFTERAGIRTSLDVDRISLGDLSVAITGQSMVTGVLGGRLDLDLFRTGAPNRFEAMLETMPVDGVPQTVDLRAVAALARSIEGESVAREIEKLNTEKLTYERFGFHARLDPGWNLRLRGRYRETEAGEMLEQPFDDLRRGSRPSPGVEYVMIGSGLHRINIRNLNPSGSVNFNDVLKRLKNLEE